MLNAFYRAISNLSMSKPQSSELEEAGFGSSLGFIVYVWILRSTETFVCEDNLVRRDKDKKGIQIRELVIIWPIIFSRNPCQLSFPAPVFANLLMAGLSCAELLY